MRNWYRGSVRGGGGEVLIVTEIILETVGLTMDFGGVRAVDHVNFKLRDGELRCLIGPNGAGKSTFFKCISGLSTPSEGHIFLAGHEVTGWATHEAASLGVGVKMQSPSVMDSLTVEDNIWLAARRFRSPRQSDVKTRDIMAQLALKPLAGAELGRLAHGERQRVELGMVAAGEPRLVLLDEPAAGMTAEELIRIRAIIEDMTRTAAVVVVEHDMQFIRAIADIVTVFHQGAILMEDRVERVMADPTVRNVYLGKKT